MFMRLTPTGPYLASTSSWTFSIDLKYLTVLTRSSFVASSLHSCQPPFSDLCDRADSLGDDQCPGVRLERTSSDHVVHTALDHLTERQSLVLARNYQYDLFRVHDRLDADRQGHARDLRKIVVEESAVVQDRLVCERLDPRAAPQRRAGLYAVSDVCVRLDRGKRPTSLNATWPSAPIPPRKRSMPPTARILFSYSSHSAYRSSALPFSRCVF